MGRRMSNKKREPPVRQSKHERLEGEAEISTAQNTTPEFVLRLIGWPKPMGWPLTIEELLASSPAEAIEKAEEERQNPTPEKLLAWHEQRMVSAVKRARAIPDPEARGQVLREAWQESRHDVNEALANAYTKDRSPDRKFSASEFMTQPNVAKPLTDKNRAFHAALMQVLSGGKIPTTCRGVRFDQRQTLLLLAFCNYRQITELEPKARMDDRVRGGGRAGGLKTAEKSQEAQAKWVPGVLVHYQSHPAMRALSYRRQTELLLSRRNRHKELENLPESGESIRKFLSARLPKLSMRSLP